MSGTGISVDEQHALYQMATTLGFERDSAKAEGGSSAITKITLRKDDALVVVEARDDSGSYCARFNDLMTTFEPVKAFSAASALTTANRVLAAREYAEPLAVPA